MIWAIGVLVYIVIATLAVIVMLARLDDDDRQK